MQRLWVLSIRKPVLPTYDARWRPIINCVLNAGCLPTMLTKNSFLTRRLNKLNSDTNNWIREVSLWLSIPCPLIFLLRFYSVLWGLGCLAGGKTAAGSPIAWTGAGKGSAGQIPPLSMETQGGDVNICVTPMLSSLSPRLWEGCAPGF